MSRSRRYTPIMGIAGGRSRSCKSWRSKENRRYRKYIRNRMSCRYIDPLESWDLLPYKNKWGNEWDSPRDGKQYFGDAAFVECPREFISIFGTIMKCDLGIHFGCKVDYNVWMRK